MVFTAGIISRGVKFFVLCNCSVQMDMDSETSQMSVMQSQAVFMVSVLHEVLASSCLMTVVDSVGAVFMFVFVARIRLFTRRE